MATSFAAAGAASSVLQMLQVSFSSPYASSKRAPAVGRTCSALPQRPRAHEARQALQRRPAAFQVVEAGHARDAATSTAGPPMSGGSGGKGDPVWHRVAAALDQSPDAAWRDFMQLVEQGARPRAQQCDRLIGALCKSGRFREAWAAFSAVRPWAGGALAYGTFQALMTLALKAGDADAALEVFRDLRAAPGRTPNVVTYCGLIAALGRQRRRGVRYAQAAHELWGELAASGAQLDCAAYRAGIKACVDVGRLREADKLLARMAAAACTPDARAYNTLLAGFARGANVAGMARLVQRMGAAGVAPTVVTFNTLVDGYVRAGDLGAAKAAAAQAAGAGVALDAWTFSTLIKGHVQAGKLAAAEAVLGDMAAAGVRPSCVPFTTLVDGHVRAGDMGAARRTLQAMQAAGVAPNAVTYNALLHGYAAAAARSSGRSRARGSSGSSSSSGSSGSEADRVADTTAAVAATEAAAGVSSPATQAAAVPAASAVAAADPLVAAQQVLGEMQAAGVAPTVETFNTLMSAAVAAGEPQLALDMHARLRASGLRPDGLTYTTLIQAHGRLGHGGDAAAAFEALLRDRSAAVDVRAYNALVDALARNGDMAAAERMLERAAELADKQALPPPVEAYGALVAGYARTLSVGPAAAVVRRFHAAGGSPDGPMLDILANVAIRAGDYRVAWQAARALELIGRDVDKAKYAALLEEVRARQAAGGAGGAAADADRPGHNRSWAAYQRRRDARKRGVALERFKFWLGLPNTYYTTDEGGSDSEAEAADEWADPERQLWQNGRS